MEQDASPSFCCEGIAFELQHITKMVRRSAVEQHVSHCINRVEMLRHDRSTISPKRILWAAATLVAMAGKVLEVMHGHAKRSPQSAFMEWPFALGEHLMRQCMI